MKRIAFIVQLPQKVSPGQRFRFELYEPILAANGFHVDTYSFFDTSSYNVLYKKGKIFSKAAGFLKGIFKRFFLLFKIRKYDYVFLQREFSPLGPPLFEWIVIKVLRCKVVYDFDDAIWLPDRSVENVFARWLKCRWKIKYICKWAYKIAVGNDYLADYAGKFNPKVIVIPTCVDTELHHNKLKIHQDENPVIGWTGSHSTLKYLEIILPVITELNKEINFTFLVISNTPPDFTIKNLRFIPWREDSEIEDLLQIDIGIMPLPDNEWSEGKCGFKLIQYMSLGIPAVASPVGVNKIIVEPGINGYLCEQSNDWKTALQKLLVDSSLRQKMGQAGRKKIEQQFSIASQKDKFLNLFS